MSAVSEHTKIHLPHKYGIGRIGCSHFLFGHRSLAVRMGLSTGWIAGKRFV